MGRPAPSRPSTSPASKASRIFFSTSLSNKSQPLLPARLHHARLPTSTPEDERADDGEGRERNRHGEEDALRPHTEDYRQHVGERNLPEPEDEEVKHGRRARVARAVERLRQDHAVSVEEEAARNRAQARDGVMLDRE